MARRSVVAGSCSVVPQPPARRGYEFARLHGEEPGLTGFARWYWAQGLMRAGARRRATAVLDAGVDELTPAVTLSGDTLAGEMAGLMHLTAAHIAAREQRPDQAHDHVDEAEHLARQLGEQNGLRQHFGPTNLAVWRVGVGVELSEGARAYEEAMRLPIDVDALGSRERSSALHLDLARALSQEGGGTATSR